MAFQRPFLLSIKYQPFTMLSSKTILQKAYSDFCSILLSFLSLIPQNISMGNCLAPQTTRSGAIKIMKIDGKMLTYESPIKVYQVLEGSPGHMISDPLSMPPQLGLMSDMVSGRQYYMLPVEKQSETGFGHDSVVRVKLVISKKELKEMLTKEEVQLEDMISLFQASDHRKENDEESIRGWRPSLASIPEGC